MTARKGTWPKCWCGEDLIEEVDGFLFGGWQCPKHSCWYEEGDRGHKVVIPKNERSLP